jgi:hypothetical protein
VPAGATMDPISGGIAIGFFVILVVLSIVVLAPRFGASANAPNRDATSASLLEDEPSANGSGESRKERMTINWPRMIDNAAFDLLFEERCAIVERLGVIGQDWGGPILRQALHEERDPRIIDLIADALQAKRYV